MTASHSGERTLHDYVQVLRRRKLIVIQCVLLVPLAAVLLSLKQSPLYEANAEVLLSFQNLASSLNGASNPYQSQLPDRVAQTQADLARVPTVATAAIKLAQVRGATPDFLLTNSSVSSSTNSDILDFRVTAANPPAAERLATAYARAFTNYRRQLDTTSLSQARRDVQVHLKQLRDAGDRKSALYATLVGKDEQLATMQALQTNNAQVVRVADGAAKVRPRPVRNGILGLGLGLVLGLGLAFLWEALDTRIRSGEEVEGRLGLPLLGRIPEPSKSLRTKDRLAMLESPGGPAAEAFRVLRMNIDFASVGRNVKTLLITSAVAAEGKSTTAANLAVAYARGGKRVILVDLDLRRPFLDRFFGLLGPGLTEVVIGTASLAEALQPVAVPLSGRDRRAPGAPGTQGMAVNTNGHGEATYLRVIAAGPMPPNVGEFVGTGRPSRRSFRKFAMMRIS